MTIDDLTQYCKDGGWRFVTKPDNILTFDNPDILFVSKQNDLVGCVVANTKEQQSRNYLLRRLYQIRSSYPDSMQLVLLNGEKVAFEEGLTCFCHAVGMTEDAPYLINNLITDGKGNKELFKVSKKFRLQRTERANQILSIRKKLESSLEKVQDLYATPWMTKERMRSDKIYQSNDGCIVQLKSAKDLQVLTMLNFMDVDLFNQYYCFNNDYLNMPRWGIVRGSFSDVRKHELSLKYAQLGVKCIFDGSDEED